MHHGLFEMKCEVLLFINDVIYVIENSNMYYYADDNTVSHKHEDLYKIVYIILVQLC